MPATYSILKNIPVTLSEADYYAARSHGIKMREESLARGYKDKPSVTAGTELQISIQGALAEMAFLRARQSNQGLRINNFKEADVEEDIQIRSSGNNFGGLIIRPADNPGHKYVLVTGAGRKWIIRGWFPGTRGVQLDRFKWRDVWLVPQNHLLGFITQ